MATGVSKSNYLENAVLNHFLRGGTAVAQPASVHVGLFSDTAGSVTVDQPATEMVGTGYGRVVATFGASTTGTTSNTGAITFTNGNASGGAAWPAANYVGIWDAATVGNLLYWGPMATPKTLAATDKLDFAIGQIVINED